MADSDNIPDPLERLHDGEDAAIEGLTPALYAELRRVAAAYLRRERADHTLQPTALVNEAYLRLVGQRQLAWDNRARVLGVAAHVMRLILVDHARARGRVKRAGMLTRVTFEGLEVEATQRDMELVALDEALRELASVDEQLCRVVGLRFFGGLTVPEVAAVLGISPRSVDRAWETARAWLQRQLESGERA